MKPNTIDLRGIEQSVTRSMAETFAATNGYEMMYFGHSPEPQDVDPAKAHPKGIVDQHFWHYKEHNIYRRTGHVLKYPARQYCARCGAAMFVTDEANTQCTGDI